MANPINVLCDLLSKVIDADGRITVPHFYDDVEEVPAAEREMIAQIPFDEKKYMEAIGVKALKGEKGYSTLERNSCRPSFDVCGIWGGYTGEGSKTVLLLKPTPKFPAVWSLTSSMKNLPAVCRLSHTAGTRLCTSESHSSAWR